MHVGGLTPLNQAVEQESVQLEAHAAPARVPAVDPGQRPTSTRNVPSTAPWASPVLCSWVPREEVDPTPEKRLRVWDGGIPGF